MKVIKRDGKKVDFDGTKIAIAIKKSFDSVNTESDICKYDETDVNKIYNLVIEEINKKNTEKINIEEIQDLIEEKLKEKKYLDVYESFSEYRERRAQARSLFIEEKKQHKFLKALEDLTLKKEITSKGILSPYEMMVDYGSTVSHEFAKAYNLKKRFTDLHDSGEIHVHDLNFMPLGTTTSSQINLLKLYDEGFNTKNLHIREPQDIMSYAALAVLAINLNQKEQHGCQGIPAFDYYMAPGVVKTFRKQFKQTLYDILIYTDLDKFVATNGIEREIEKIEHIDFDIEIFDKYSRDAEQVKKAFRVSYEIAMDKTRKIVSQAMEAFIHDTNVMNTRGKEKIYPCINLGTDVTMEGRMVTSKILDSIDFGIQNENEVLSPIVIFKVKEGINFNKEDKNYDLYKKAIDIATRRNYPEFSFLDAEFNKKFYIKNEPESEVAYNSSCMRVMENIIDEDKQFASQRGVISYATINLARIGIKNSHILKLEEVNTKLDTNTQQIYQEKKYEDFYNELEEKLNIIKDELLDRFEKQASQQVREFPFLIGQGIWLDGDRAKEEDRIRKVIKHGSLGIGFVGLEECISALTGEKRQESKNAQKLGLNIVEFMANKANEFCNKYNLNFRLIGIEEDDVSMKFMANDKAIYGTIKNVTDKEKYTNSFHCNVNDIRKKMDIEASYHIFTNGGHVFEIEYDKITNNELEHLLKYAKEKNIGLVKFRNIRAIHNITL